MEIRGHPVGRRYPDIIRQEGVHRTLEPLGRPSLWHTHTHPLAMGVNTCIRPSRTDGGDGGGTESGQDGLHLALHGAGVGLALPAGKAPPIVLGYQEDRSRVRFSGDSAIADGPMLRFSPCPPGQPAATLSRLAGPRTRCSPRSRYGPDLLWRDHGGTRPGASIVLTR
jgi:hypothetical protein